MYDTIYIPVFSSLSSMTCSNCCTEPSYRSTVSYFSPEQAYNISWSSRTLKKLWNQNLPQVKHLSMAFRFHSVCPNGFQPVTYQFAGKLRDTKIVKRQKLHELMTWLKNIAIIIISYNLIFQGSYKFSNLYFRRTLVFSVSDLPLHA